MEAIADVDARIDALPRGSHGRKTLERMFNGQSMPTELDPDGRLVLAQKLRDKIGLEGEAFFHRVRRYVPDLEARDLRG